MAKAYKVADWSFNESKKCFVSWLFCMGRRLLHNVWSLYIYYTIPYHYILYHTVIYYYILYHAIIYYTIPLYTIIYYTMPLYTIPCHYILYYVIIYYTMPLYYTIPCHYILYHAIIYYTRRTGAKGGYCHPAIRHVFPMLLSGGIEC